MASSSAPLLEGINSLLDTDLYKLTMQCCVLKYFPDVHVTYNFTNRTPHMKFTRAAFNWLNTQIKMLANLSVSEAELAFLRKDCPYLTSAYLSYLSNFRLHPEEQVQLSFHPEKDTGADADIGAINIHTAGSWVETILYEIPLLALVSEAYFKFCDTSWTYDGQIEQASNKGSQLLKEGCVFSEFGTRRRRDYHTQDLVLHGLIRSRDDGKEEGWPGKVVGTSNVHFAMKYGVTPIGTVAHEWFMGIAAITDDYENANEIALRYWVGTFGQGVLGIALTDTYGTPAFLRAFKQSIPAYTSAATNPTSAALASNSPTTSSIGATSHPPIQANGANSSDTSQASPSPKTYADVFTGVRQDSGDPLEFVSLMKQFYSTLNSSSSPSTQKKTIVFSDSLNISLCLKYKSAAEAAGFAPTFGIGTFFTNDYLDTRSREKSHPLNIVIKLASAAGNPAVKISDNIGKNTGDREKVEEVKRRLGYVEKEWADGDEGRRW